MYGSTNNTYGSYQRRYGEVDSSAQTHHIITVTDALSRVSDLAQRTPLGAAFGKVFDVAHMFGRLFNPRINQ